MAKVFPINPKHPERICWGCDKYCPVDSLACGNGSDRTQHPIELWGEGWQNFGLNAQDKQDGAPSTEAGEADPPPQK
ncbi:MAG TPA: DUF3079 domain-containing protein [Burkholderiaceae bacterium]|nr:DUF3079 domain-containing protein [Burkholderiaceae bacterium]